MNVDAAKACTIWHRSWFKSNLIILGPGRKHPAEPRGRVSVLILVVAVDVPRVDTLELPHPALRVERRLPRADARAAARDHLSPQRFLATAISRPFLPQISPMLRHFSPVLSVLAPGSRKPRKNGEKTVQNGRKVAEK